MNLKLNLKYLFRNFAIELLFAHLVYYNKYVFVKEFILKSRLILNSFQPTIYLSSRMK